MAPERIIFAVDLLELRPSDAVLEIGCGRGAAASLVLPRIPEGAFLGVDRSAAAIRAAGRTGGSAVAAGRASFAISDFAEIGRLRARFDRVLAVNVNRFWQNAEDEAEIWGAALTSEARLARVYESPPGTVPEREEAGAQSYLEANGSRAIEVRPLSAGSRCVGITAHWG